MEEKKNKLNDLKERLMFVANNVKKIEDHCKRFNPNLNFLEEERRERSCSRSPSRSNSKETVRKQKRAEDILDVEERKLREKKSEKNMKKFNRKESKESQVSDNSMTRLRRQIKPTLAMKEYQKQKKIDLTKDEKKQKKNLMKLNFQIYKQLIDNRNLNPKIKGEFFRKLMAAKFKNSKK